MKLFSLFCKIILLTVVVVPMFKDIYTGYDKNIVNSSNRSDYIVDICNTSTSFLEENKEFAPIEYSFEIEDTSLSLIEGTIVDETGKNTLTSYSASSSYTQESMNNSELDEIKNKVDKLLKKMEKENSKIDKEREAEQKRLKSLININNTVHSNVTYQEVVSTGSITYNGITIPTGTRQLPNAIYQYDNLINKYATKFNVDKNMIRAIICQESSANEKALTGVAAGLMQIHATLESEFISFGRKYFGQTWTLADRYDPEKNIAFGTFKFRNTLDHYKGDYIKALQGYTFSYYSLDKLIAEYPTDWLHHRSEMAYYNGYYQSTGNSSYGDSKYIENVLRYYYK